MKRVNVGVLVVKCEWKTCKHNAGGECQAEVIELVHVDNDKEDRDEWQEALQCQQYEWGGLEK